MKKKQSTQCTIRRIVVVRHSTIDMQTGKETPGKTQVVTEACGTPLFGDPTGVCRSCAEGWQVKGNKFASDKEKTRAAASRKEISR